MIREAGLCDESVGLPNLYTLKVPKATPAVWWRKRSESLAWTTRRDRIQSLTGNEGLPGCNDDSLSSSENGFVVLLVERCVDRHVNWRASSAISFSNSLWENISSLPPCLQHCSRWTRSWPVSRPWPDLWMRWGLQSAALVSMIRKPSVDLFTPFLWLAIPVRVRRFALFYSQSSCRFPEFRPCLLTRSAVLSIALLRIRADIYGVSR